MATVKVIDIVRKAENLLFDTSGTRWTRIELQDFINAAYTAILGIDVEANAQLATVTLAVGVHQDLTDVASINLPTAIAVLDVKRNTAATSTKRSITPISGVVLDDMVPDWRVTTGSVSIKHWIPDGRNQTEFDVYPPAATATTVEILYSSLPARHALTAEQLDPSAGNTTVINLDDYYENAIIDYVMYKALVRESDSQIASNLAAFHLNAFRASMGVIDKPIQIPRPSQPRETK